METLSPPPIYEKTGSLKGRLKGRLLSWLHLTEQPVVKVYRGFGNDHQLTIHGSVFHRSALPRTKYRSNIWVNLLGLIRLFLVKPYPHVTVTVCANDQTAQAKTDAEGYFRLEMKLPQPLPPGWHRVQVQLIHETILAESEGSVLVPHQTEFACISDIDDTFLVSHSATITKRLTVLLTRNARTRKPFEGVVAHYRLLAEANSGPAVTNPFFYVSSSEWNLYDYILEFSEKNGLPEGVYFLSPLKRLKDVLATGQNKHMTKFMRIVRILEAYPNQRFILLGDDTQEDPTIYASIVEHFPTQIRCVYIRQVHGKNEPETRAKLAGIEAKGVPYCYFAHSAEARQHSIDNGLVAT
ncbi:App1 family protein [soil metagenome]